jgi:hypothetical protein
MLNLAMFVEDLDLAAEELKHLDRKTIETCAYQAINHTADFARAASAKEINKQINFPASYLNPSQGRLKVAKHASSSDLEAVIVGRHRATSLARFVTSGTIGKSGLTVSVARGKTKEMKRAFLMSLKRGAEGIDTAKNLGLAVRVEKGTRPVRAWKPVRISDGLFLLYGPAVSQVFKSVRNDVSPDVEKELSREFLRLLELRT